MKFLNTKKFLQGIMIASVVAVPYCIVNTVHTPIACGDQTASNSAECNTPTNTPTPTKVPHCDYWTNRDYNCGYPSPSVSPIPSSITPIPSESPTPTSTPSGSTTSTGSTGSSGGSNNAPPTAQCTTSFPAVKITTFTDKGNGTVNFAWTEVQTYSKISITYGLSPNNLNMGEDNIPGNATNWDIHDLPVGSHVWAQVQAWVNGCEESSNVFDPLVK